MPEGEEKVPYSTFAKTIKEKYPDYADVDDRVLAEKMVEKYPEYKDRVVFDEATDEKKKSLPSPSPLVSSSTESLSTPGVSASSAPDYLQGSNQITMPPAQTPAPLVIPQNQQNLMQSVSTPATTTAKDQNNYDPALNKQIMKGGILSEGALRGGANLVSSVLKSPSFAWDIASSLANSTITDPTGNSYGTLPSSEDIAKKLPADNPIAALDAAVDASRKDFQAKYDKPISQYFSEGDYSKGVEALGAAIAETAPATISLMLGNAAGVSGLASIGAGGLVFGADKMSQIDKEVEESKRKLINGDQLDPQELLQAQSQARMSHGEKTSVALVNGLLEGALEQFGMTKLGGAAMNIFKSSGKEAAEKFAKEGFIKTYGKILGKYAGIAAEEPLQEMATQFAQNVLDKASGLKPNLDLSEGVKDAGIVSFAMGVPSSAAVGALEVAKTKSAVKKAADLAEKKKALENDIASPDVSDEAKPVLVNKVRDINEEEFNLASEEKKKFNDLTPEGQQQVDGLLSESKKLADAASDESVSDQTKEILKKDIDAVDKKIDEVYETQKKEPVKEPAATEAKPEAQQTNTESASEMNPADEAEYLREVEKNFGLSEEEKTRLSELDKQLNPEGNVTTQTPQESAAPVQQEAQPQEKVVDKGNETPVETDQEAKSAKVAEQAEQQNTTQNGKEAEKTDKAENGLLTQQEAQEQEPQEEPPVSSKKENKQELVDEEEAKDKEVKDSPETLKKLDDEITAMKAADPKVMDQKFTGMLERAYKAYTDKKISHNTYRTFKKRMSDVYSGKKKIDAEEMKIKSTALINKVKEKLLGQGYEAKTLSSAIPITPKNVADLLDLTNKLIHRGIDAGFTLADATKKAITAVKKHPVYKKLVDSKELNEAEFEKAVKDAHKEVATEDKKSSKEAGITGEERERATNERIYDNKRFEDVASHVDSNSDIYESVNQQKAVDYINKKLDEFEKEGTLFDLGQELTTEKGSSIFPQSISLLAPIVVADRIRQVADRATNKMQADAANKLAAKVLDQWRKNTTTIAQQLGLTSVINNFMPKSSAGIKEKIKREASDVQDSHMTKKDKDNLKDLQGEVSGKSEDPSTAQKIKDLVKKEWNNILESFKGKNFASKFNDALDSIKTNAQDC